MKIFIYILSQIIRSPETSDEIICQRKDLSYEIQLFIAFLYINKYT